MCSGMTSVWDRCELAGHIRLPRTQRLHRQLEHRRVTPEKLFLGLGLRHREGHRGRVCAALTGDGCDGDGGGGANEMREIASVSVRPVLMRWV